MTIESYKNRTQKWTTPNYRPRSREIMNVLGGICPSVCLCVCLSSPVCLSELSCFGVKGGHYQSEGFVCVSVIRRRRRIISWMCSISL